MMVALDKPRVASQDGGRVFITDCEGPVSKNDNAYELSSHFIPRGGELFRRISRYDDILADLVKRPGYKAGDTLKLILPFLKAYGATDEEITAYSRRSILLIPKAIESLRYVMEIMPSYIISTSYRHYIEAVCDVLELPIENAYSTQLSLNRYEIDEGERERLKELCREILRMPILDPPPRSLEELSREDKRILERLDGMFWGEISSMGCGRMLSEVNPIGGEGKAEAVKEIALKNDCTIADIIYFGDSITDVAPLRLVREAGGVSVSFNGNEYAIREAEIAVISGTATPTAALAYLFKHGGRELVLEAASEWTIERLEGKFSLPSRLVNALKSYGSEIPLEVSVVTGENRMRLIERSRYARKTLRGEAIGSLG